MTTRSKFFSRRVATILALIVLAALMVGVGRAQAFDIEKNEFTDGGRIYTLILAEADFLYSYELVLCDGRINFSELGYDVFWFGISSLNPMYSITSVWEAHGTITAYSGVCADPYPGGDGSNLLCNQVVVAERFERYSIQEISFTGNRNVASAGFYLPGVDGLVAIDGLNYDWVTRTWSGTFDASRIPPGEYRGVYMAVYNTAGEQFKCLLGKFVVE